MDPLRIGWILSLLLAMVYIAGCDAKGKRVVYKSPPGYDFSHPYIIKLPFELDEVSGIAYYPKDTSLFMQIDEKGNIYKMSLVKPDYINKWKIAESADYEDIVLLDSTFFLLKSNGNVLAVTILGDHKVNAQEYRFPWRSDNEFEILYYDSVVRKLVMICKDCTDEKKKVTRGYVFDPYARNYSANALAINVKQINRLTGRKIGRFKPSAASINPLTGSLYIISAIDRVLVIADRNGNVKASYNLDPGLFKQPEGLAFTPGGTLIISNESADVGMANILVFKVNRKAKQLTR